MLIINKNTLCLSVLNIAKHNQAGKGQTPPPLATVLQIVVYGL